MLEYTGYVNEKWIEYKYINKWLEGLKANFLLH